MITVSVSDLQLIPELSHLGEAKMISLENELLVSKYLYQLGLDTQQGYKVVALKHRNLQGKVVVGYKYSGEIRTDKGFRDSPFCTFIDRICMAHKGDVGLATELLGMLRVTGSGYGHSFTKPEDLPPELQEDDFKDTLSMLESLEQFALALRGDCYTEYGNLKNIDEWLGNK